MSPAPRRARSRPDLPRLVAWRLLRAVDERQAYANLLLPKLIEDAGERLDARDRMFITELGYGALRWQGSLDLLLSQGMSRPLDAVDPPVRDALRLGAYQLLRTRVPARAAVASTVELVRTTVGEHAVRFANAVLRRAAELVMHGGRCVAEFDPAVAGVRTSWVRLESSHTIGPWFPWAAVGVDCAAALAEEAGLALMAIHPIGDRVVATLALT